MGTSFSPTPQDVERYRGLRALAISLNNRIIQTVPSRAYDEVGAAIGILHNGVLVFDSEDMSSVMMDCCLYDWYENGKNLMRRYVETHPAEPGTDEACLLHAYLQAKYRILVAHSTVPGAGLHCEDVLNGGELFLMDVGMSRTLEVNRLGLATRTVPMDGYWMTGGAGLPANAPQAALETFRRALGEVSPGVLEMSIVRTCLAAGAADHVAYETAGFQPSKPRHRLPKHTFKRRK